MNDSDISDMHDTETENITDNFIDIAEISAIFAESDDGTQPVVNQTIYAKFKEMLTNQPNQLQVFVNKLYAKVNDIFEKCCSVSVTEPKIWTKYHTDVYQYSAHQNM